jgi:hypothetical protein
VKLIPPGSLEIGICWKHLLLLDSFINVIHQRGEFGHLDTLGAANSMIDLFVNKNNSNPYSIHHVIDMRIYPKSVDVPVFPLSRRSVKVRLAEKSVNMLECVFLNFVKLLLFF